MDIFLLFCDLLLMAILRCPSLVGIPKHDPGNLMSVSEALLVPDIQEIHHDFSLQTDNQGNNNRIKITHLLVPIFKISNLMSH